MSSHHASPGNTATGLRIPVVSPVPIWPSLFMPLQRNLVSYESKNCTVGMLHLSLPLCKAQPSNPHSTHQQNALLSVVIPHEWPTPMVTLLQVVGPTTRAGVVLSWAELSMPHWP